MAKEKVGECKCHMCGERVVWKRGERSDSYSYTCQDCDFRGYAPAGSLVARKLEKRFQAAPAVGDESPPVRQDDGGKPEKPVEVKSTKPLSAWDIACGARP